MDLSLSNRTALVAGASSGLGLGCAQALAAEGCKVVMVSRNIDRLCEAQAGGVGLDAAELIAADVSDRQACEAMIDEAEKRVGPIDIVVPNAGGPPPGTFASTSVEAYSGAIDLNMMSTIVMCKRLIPAMQERGWGRVVAVTSISVRQPIDQLILSNTARAGLTAFLKTTATEVAKDGVTVNSLQPGLHATARLGALADLEQLAQTVPTKTLGDAEDFGKIVAFLCSDAANFITGAAIPVDGGAAQGLQ